MTELAPDGSKRPWWWLRTGTREWRFVLLQLVVQGVIWLGAVSRLNTGGWRALDGILAVGIPVLTVVIVGCVLATRRTLAREAAAEQRGARQ